MNIGYLGMLYPGRLLTVHMPPSGGEITAVIAQTGRSEASRKRKITRVDDTFVVGPMDTNAQDDPLRYYIGAIAKGRYLYAGNGRQVEKLANRKSGPTVFDTLESFEYEDDSLGTPRITAMVDLETAQVLFGIAARGANGKTVRTTRSFDLYPGDLWAMHTYRGSAKEPRADGYSCPLDSEGAKRVDARFIWQHLTPRNPEWRVGAASVTAPIGGSWAAGEWNIVNRELGD